MAGKGPLDLLEKTGHSLAEKVCPKRKLKGEVKRQGLPHIGSLTLRGKGYRFTVPTIV